jgi:hypothetical protein
MIELIESLDSRLSNHDESHSARKKRVRHTSGLRALTSEAMRVTRGLRNLNRVGEWRGCTALLGAIFCAVCANANVTNYALPSTSSAAMILFLKKCKQNGEKVQTRRDRRGECESG